LNNTIEKLLSISPCYLTMTTHQFLITTIFIQP
jgi:hypothetical protein